MSAPQLPPHIVDPRGRVWPLKGPPGMKASPLPGVQLPAPALETQPPPRRAADAGGVGSTRRRDNANTGGRQKGTIRRRRSYRPHTIAFVDVASGQGVSDAGDSFKARRPFSLASLVRALPADVERVFLIGDRPGDDLDGFHHWIAKLPKGWAADMRGHYLENLTLPVLRYETTNEEGPRRKLEIHRAAAWFGDAPATPGAARDALAMVGQLIAAAFDGATMLATPGTTGRDLFVRSVPFGDGLALLPDDAQQLIRSTTGQGRIEVFPRAGELAQLVECDGRFMYGALCRNLGVGLVDHRESVGDELTDELVGDRRAQYRPARYRVAFTVPTDWRGPGLFGVMGGRRADGWAWPAKPRHRGETWADGAEVLLALRHGWRVRVRERLVFGDGTPLDTWSRKLVALWSDIYPGDEPATGTRRLARAAIRNMVLHTIGAFVGRAHVVTRSVAVGDERAVPADAIALRDGGDGRVYFGVRTPPAWPELSHPEWAAAVWGRCRARMLSGPHNTGALHVDPSSLVAIDTDALYLTEYPGGWADDGKPGRLRVKATRRGPFPAPRVITDVRRMREGRGTRA